MPRRTHLTGVERRFKEIIETGELTSATGALIRATVESMRAGGRNILPLAQGAVRVKACRWRKRLDCPVIPDSLVDHFAMHLPPQRALDAMIQARLDVQMQGINRGISRRAGKFGGFSGK